MKKFLSTILMTLLLLILVPQKAYADMTMDNIPTDEQIQKAASKTIADEEAMDASQASTDKYFAAHSHKVEIKKYHRGSGADVELVVLLTITCTTDSNYTFYKVYKLDDLTMFPGGEFSFGNETKYDSAEEISEYIKERGLIDGFPAVAPKSDDKLLERVEIKVESKTVSDGKLVVSGTMKSKSEIVSKAIFRTEGGSVEQGFINLTGDKFTAECSFISNTNNVVKITADNKAQLGAEYTITLDGSGNFTKEQTTSNKGDITKNVPASSVPGIGKFGNLPLPKNISNALVGIFGPGILSVLIGTMFGGGAPTVPSPTGGNTVPVPGIPDGTTRVYQGKDGRTYTVKYDGSIGRWINVENGNYFDPDKFGAWQNELENDRKWSQAEREKMSTQRNDYDKQNDEMARRHVELETALKNLQYIGRRLTFDPTNRGLWREPGKPGNMNDHVNKLINEIMTKRKVGDNYNKVLKAYGDYKKGRTAGYYDLPKRKDYDFEGFKEGFKDTAVEAFTGDSYKARAFQLGIMIASSGAFGAAGTLGTSGWAYKGFYAANNLGNLISASNAVKKYFDKGGDSDREALWEGIKQLAWDKGTEVAVGVGINLTKYAGGTIVMKSPKITKVLEEMIEKDKNHDVIDMIKKSWSSKEVKPGAHSSSVGGEHITSGGAKGNVPEVNIKSEAKPKGTGKTDTVISDTNKTINQKSEVSVKNETIKPNEGVKTEGSKVSEGSGGETTANNAPSPETSVKDSPKTETTVNDGGKSETSTKPETQQNTETSTKPETQPNTEASTGNQTATNTGAQPSEKGSVKPAEDGVAISKESVEGVKPETPDASVAKPDTVANP